MYSELKDLEPGQQQLLVALATTMIEADGAHTGEESKALQKVGALIGPQQFVAAAQAVRGRSRDAVLAEAAELRQPKLREAFFQLLLDLAKTDGLQVAEVGLLRRLTDLWQIEWTP